MELLLDSKARSRTELTYSPAVLAYFLMLLIYHPGSDTWPAVRTIRDLRSALVAADGDPR